MPPGARPGLGSRSPDVAPIQPVKPADLGVALAIMVIWGLNFPLAKTALEEIPPIFAMSLRFGLIAALMLPFVRVPRGRFGALFVLAVTLGLVHFSLMFTGVSRLDGAVAAVATQIQVVFAAGLAWVFFGDRIRWRRALGISIAIAGVAVLAGEPRLAADPWPLAMVIGAAFMWALANVQMKKMQDVDGFTLTAWMALFAAPMQFGASLVLERGQREAFLHASWPAWGGVLYMAIMVGIVSYLAWLWLLRRHPINVVMPFTLLVPVFGAAFSIWLRGEPATWNLLVGGALTVAGVGIIVLRRPGTAAPDAAAKSA